MIIISRIHKVGSLNGGGYEKRIKSVRVVVSPFGVSPTLLAKAGENEDIVKVMTNEKHNGNGQSQRGGL